jgi:hypothetical protein
MQERESAMPHGKAATALLTANDFFRLKALSQTSSNVVLPRGSKAKVWAFLVLTVAISTASLYPSTTNGSSLLVKVWHTNNLFVSSNQTDWYDLQTNHWSQINPTGALFFRGLNMFTNCPVTNVLYNEVDSLFTNYYDTGFPIGAVYATTNPLNYYSGGSFLYTNVWTGGSTTSSLFQWFWCGNCALWDPGCNCRYGWGPPTTNEYIQIHWALGQLVNGQLFMGPTNSYQTYSPTNSILITWPYFYNFNEQVHIRTSWGAAAGAAKEN